MDTYICGYATYEVRNTYAVQVPPTDKQYEDSVVTATLERNGSPYVGNFTVEVVNATADDQV